MKQNRELREGISRQWLRRVHRVMMTLVPQFTTGRHVKKERTHVHRYRKS